jgi:hypothetical protein
MPRCISMNFCLLRHVYTRKKSSWRERERILEDFKNKQLTLMIEIRGKRSKHKERDEPKKMLMGQTRSLLILVTCCLRRSFGEWMHCGEVILTDFCTDCGDYWDVLWREIAVERHVIDGECCVSDELLCSPDGLSWLLRELTRLLHKPTIFWWPKTHATTSKSHMIAL